MLSAYDVFESRIPTRCRSTDDYSTGTSIRYKEKSIKKRYIQPNSSTHLYYLVFDLDLKKSSLQWEIQDAPPPNLIVINKENSHSHYLYSLETSVCTADYGSLKAIKYASAIQKSLIFKLKSDPSYSGNLAKNPLSDHWLVDQPRLQNYSLNELEDYLDLKASNKDLKQSGLGRNVETFDMLRHWAYKSYRQGYPSFERFYEACIHKAEGINIKFNEPLPFSEIKAIAKSVAKYVARNFSQESFSQWCSAKGRIGGRKSKRKPVVGSESTTQPWIKLGISRRTYYNRKKQGKL